MRDSHNRPLEIGKWYLVAKPTEIELLQLDSMVIREAEQDRNWGFYRVQCEEHGRKVLKHRNLDLLNSILFEAQMHRMALKRNFEQVINLLGQPEPGSYLYDLVVASVYDGGGSGYDLVARAVFDGANA